MSVQTSTAQRPGVAAGANANGGQLAPRLCRWEQRLWPVVGWLLTALFVAVAVFCVGWRLDGGRWERVETPSLGTAAPVGTLLWVRPVPFDSLRTGDIVSFRPPGRGQVYSHLVQRVGADGRLRTRGAITATDPWTIGPAEVVGRVEMRWWGGGWLLASAPLLLAGAAVVSLARRLVGREQRLPVTLVLGSVTLTLALWWHRPLVAAERLGWHRVPGGADATYVGTGLLPVRIAPEGRSAVTVAPGEVATVAMREPDRTGMLHVDLAPALPWWWWLVVVLVCLLPALVVLVVGLPPEDEQLRRLDEDPSDPAPPAAGPGTGATAAATTTSLERLLGGRGTPAAPT